jgi:hypothetical protein
LALLLLLYQISDELRKLLLCDDSAHAALYSSEEQQQLLWRLFQLLCLGGPCCQFEVCLDGSSHIFCYYLAHKSFATILQSFAI